MIDDYEVSRSSTAGEKCRLPSPAPPSLATFAIARVAYPTPPRSWLRTCDCDFVNLTKPPRRNPPGGFSYFPRLGRCLETSNNSVLMDKITMCSTVVICSWMTPRKKTILALAGCGLTNPQIAEYLGTNSKNVENQFSRICLKLDAANKTQAVVKALELGLLDHKLINFLAEEAATTV